MAGAFGLGGILCVLVTGLLSEAEKIYEVYHTAEGVACPEFAFVGPNLLQVQGQEIDESGEGEDEGGEEWA